MAFNGDGRTDRASLQPLHVPSNLQIHYLCSDDRDIKKQHDGVSVGKTFILNLFIY